MCEFDVNGITVVIEEVKIADIPALQRGSKWQPLLTDLTKRLEVTNGSKALRYDFPDKRTASSFMQAVRKAGIAVKSQTRVFDGCTALFLRHANRKPYKGREK